ncbi:hypothetical protein FHU35_1889 [Saccharopolyspora dendranthemae]|uniref:Uncharacterized protein n=1 Tax=Saccharopolyspora dendranthemae TaxID=1181886 RepID=A0A561TX21_9PSEU|nr:hypothetical protein FHU35_1889 [Saccharopolyspora dendranthemae]
MHHVSLAISICIFYFGLFGCNYAVLSTLAEWSGRVIMGDGARGWLRRIPPVREIFLVVAMAACPPLIFIQLLATRYPSREVLVAAGLFAAVLSLAVPFDVAYRTPLREFRAGQWNSTAWKYWFDGSMRDKAIRCVRDSIVWKNVGRCNSAALFVLAVPVAAPYFTGSRAFSPEWKILLSDDGVRIIGEVLLFWMAAALSRRVIAEKRLAEACFYRQEPSADGEVTLVGLSRWRFPHQEQAFLVAVLLERFLPRLQPFYSTGHFQEVSVAYLNLATYLREESSRQPQKIVRTDMLRTMAITIVTNEDLLATARRISRLTPCYHKEFTPVSRFARFVNRINATLEQNAKSIGLLLALIVVAYYLVTGQGVQLVEFLKSLASL